MTSRSSGPGLVPYVDKASFIFSSAGKDEPAFTRRAARRFHQMTNAQVFFYEPVLSSSQSKARLQGIGIPRARWRGIQGIHDPAFPSQSRMDSPGARHQQSKPMLIEPAWRGISGRQPRERDRDATFQPLSHCPMVRLKVSISFTTMALTETGSRRWDLLAVCM